MRVLFVSKPIVAPYHDGTRCLVRDLSTHMREARPSVLGTRTSAPPGPGVEVERVYDEAGSFAPQIADNARVLLRLLAGRRHDVWNFVFAPNLPSSSAARLAVLARRVPTVQTVASVPRSFDRIQRLLFGHKIVCQSESTRAQLVAAGADARRIEVILTPLVPPPVSDDERAAALASQQIAGGELPLVYPGDLEFSGGARAVAAACAEITAKIPEAVVIFACRAKTPRAREIEASLRAQLAPLGRRVRFAGQVPSLPALLAVSRLVLFPVDDLYGKVDLPLSLLEAQALGVPVVALQKGPLRELTGAFAVEREAQLADVVIEALRDAKAWEQHRDEGRAAVQQRHDPARAAQAYEAVYRSLLR